MISLNHGKAMGMITCVLETTASISPTLTLEKDGKQTVDKAADTDDPMQLEAGV